LAQARAAGKRADFLLGLNDGAEFPDIKRLCVNENVNVIDLYVNEAASMGTRGAPPLMPAEDVFDNRSMEGEPFIMG
jgi:hypothetical protein